MPEGLWGVLLGLGLGLFLMALAQQSMKHEFGDRVAEILRKNGFENRAQGWSKERGVRAITLWTWVWCVLGGILVLAGLVVLAIGGI